MAPRASATAIDSRVAAARARRRATLAAIGKHAGCARDLVNERYGSKAGRMATLRGVAFQSLLDPRGFQLDAASDELERNLRRTLAT